MPRVHEDVCVRPIVLPKLYGGVPFRCTGSHIENVPTVEELTMGCTRVNVPAPLGSHDDREQERADGHQERKRARVARPIIDKGNVGAISTGLSMLMATKRLVTWACRWYGKPWSDQGMSVLSLHGGHFMAMPQCDRTVEHERGRDIPKLEV